jgi:hypothetical protein
VAEEEVVGGRQIRAFITATLCGTALAFFWLVAIYFIVPTISADKLANSFIFFLVSFLGFYGEIVVVVALTLLVYRQVSQELPIVLSAILAPLVQLLGSFVGFIFFRLYAGAWFWPTLTIVDPTLDIPLLIFLSSLLGVIFAFFLSERGTAFFSRLAQLIFPTPSTEIMEEELSEEATEEKEES